MIHCVALALMILPALIRPAYADIRTDKKEKALVFLDRQGREVNRIAAGDEHGAPAVEERAGHRHGRDGRQIPVREKVMRRGRLAKSKNAALVAENAMAFRDTTDPSVQAHSDGTEDNDLEVQAALEYYDSTGKQVWRKNFDPGLEVMATRLSAKGEIAGAIIGCTMHCESLGPKGASVTLKLWNAAGRELVSVTPSRCTLGSLGFWFSPNGRYAVTSCSEKGKLPASIVLDADRRQVAYIPTLVDVYEITASDTLLMQSTDGRGKSSDSELELRRLSWEPVP